MYYLLANESSLKLKEISTLGFGEKCQKKKEFILANNHTVCKADTKFSIPIFIEEIC